MEVNGQIETRATLTLATSLQYTLDTRLSSSLSQSDCGGEQQHLSPDLQVNCDWPSGNQTLNYMSYAGYTNIPHFCSRHTVTAVKEFLCSETATALHHVLILTL